MAMLEIAISMNTLYHAEHTNRSEYPTTKTKPKTAADMLRTAMAMPMGTGGK
jgi:hypothetical protein